MPYSATRTATFTGEHDARSYLTAEVTEATVASGTVAGETFYLDVPWEHATLTLYEAKLTVPGTATTIQPELGLALNWTDDTLDEVVQTDSPAGHHRIGVSVRLATNAKKLYVRSQPNGAATEIKHRITIVEGH